MDTWYKEFIHAKRVGIRRPRQQSLWSPRISLIWHIDLLKHTLFLSLCNFGNSFCYLLNHTMFIIIHSINFMGVSGLWVFKTRDLVWVENEMEFTLIVFYEGDLACVLFRCSWISVCEFSANTCLQVSQHVWNTPCNIFWRTLYI